VQEGLPVHAVRSHRRPTPRKTRLGLAIGTLVGVLATGAVVAPAAYAGAATKTSLGGGQSIVKGDPAVLTGKITSGGKPAAYLRVHLQSSTGNGWVNLGVKKLRGNGQVDFTVRPKTTTFYRLVFHGHSKYEGSVSPKTRVQIVTNKGAAIVRTAASLKGKPYRYGAAGPNAFDCSGYTQYVFKKHGKSLPHSATAQARYGKAVSKSAARPGDVLFFGSGGQYSHAAIYAGGNQMWDASTSGKPVAKKKIWSNKYVVRRLV
jgi:cell wall-associated NlpC family hydrolase